MNMKTLYFLPMLILGMLAFGQSSAHAADYNVMGAGCVPMEDAVQGDDYSTGGIGVFVKGTGSAVLKCPIEDPEGSWSYFYMYYSNTHVSGYEVVVKLKSTPNSSETVTTHYTCGSSGASGTSSKYCNFSNFTPSSSRRYWFEVTINRPGTFYNPEFLGLALW